MLIKLNTSGYNDLEYDGVVIKLPRSLISINKLDDLLLKFKKELEEEVKLSKMMPDYQSSLYELENWKNKKEYIENEKELKRKRIETDNAKYQRYVDREEIPFTWVKYDVNIDFFERLNFKNEEIDVEDFLYEGKKRKRHSPKRVEMLNEKFLKEIKTVEDLIELNHRSGSPCSIPNEILFGTVWRLLEEKPLYYSLVNMGGLCLRIETLSVSLYSKEKDTFSYYTTKVNNLNGTIYDRKNGKLNVSDYTIGNNILIKKK